MVFFPNCKINLGLRILRKRPDGYHDLSTVFYPLALKDVLEVVRASVDGFFSYGAPIPGDGSRDGGVNLCEKAYALLKADFPALPAVAIHLYKNIPIGAGLGGGSADGAFTLVALNRQFRLGLDEAALMGYAARLGSDCPFFIINTPCLGGGRGERLEPLALDLGGYRFVLVNPGIHISTARAFGLCIPRESATPVERIVSRPVEDWRDALVNDFEEPVFTLHPELRAIKSTLYESGAVYASMTGSGSSFYGIFTRDRVPASLPLSWNYSILQ
jgi:4-diphosphocytidyl-2-C-methyl-D-erythritol kinase